MSWLVMTERNEATMQPIVDDAPNAFQYWSLYRRFVLNQKRRPERETRSEVVSFTDERVEPAAAIELGGDHVGDLGTDRQANFDNQCAKR